MARKKDDIRNYVAVATVRALTDALDIAEDSAVPAAVRVQALTVVARMAERHLDGGYQVEAARVQVDVAKVRNPPAPEPGSVADLFGDGT